MKQLDPNSDAARDLASGKYVIRTMSLADMRAVPIPWMRAAGWNPGLHDAETFLAADPAGFLLGELSGQPIACLSAVRYDDSFGFLGCYIVDEAQRGRGYGLAIHEAGRRHLSGCTQGGDGVLENVEKYKRIGRVFAYRNARYEAVKPVGWSTPAPEATVDARQLPLSTIEALDRACFPAPRTAFLQAWLRQPASHALAVAGVGDETVLGYGVIRQCFTGWKIGPLFAQDAATADTLLRALVGRLPEGTPFVLDVAEPNSAGLELARRYGMTEVFATARMYTGPFPVVRLDWVYGVTTFELG